jgi:hypothetical protein
MASEIDDYRNDREKEEKSTAAQSHIISGYDRINGNFKNNARIDRQDMSCLAQEETRDINSNAYQVVGYQRHYFGNQENNEQQRMHEAHDYDRKLKRVTDEQLHRSAQKG